MQQVPLHASAGVPCPPPIGDDGFPLRLLPPVLLLQGPSGANPGCLNDGCTAIDLLLSFHPACRPPLRQRAAAGGRHKPSATFLCCSKAASFPKYICQPFPAFTNTLTCLRPSPCYLAHASPHSPPPPGWQGGMASVWHSEPHRRFQRVAPMNRVKGTAAILKQQGTSCQPGVSTRLRRSHPDGCMRRGRRAVLQRCALSATRMFGTLKSASPAPSLAATVHRFGAQEEWRSCRGNSPPRFGPTCSDAPKPQQTIATQTDTCSAPTASPNL